MRAIALLLLLVATSASAQGFYTWRDVVVYASPHCAGTLDGVQVELAWFFATAGAGHRSSPAPSPSDAELQLTITPMGRVWERFQGVYGAAIGSPLYDPLLDRDADGVVGFGDYRRVTEDFRDRSDLWGDWSIIGSVIEGIGPGRRFPAASCVLVRYATHPDPAVPQLDPETMLFQRCLHADEATTWQGPGGYEVGVTCPGEVIDPR